MPRYGKLALCLVILAVGCDRRDGDIRVADLVLRLPRVDDCRPTEEATAIVVQALGDFPPSDENTIDVLRPSSEPQLIDRFPPETEIIGVRVTAGTWTGIGARIVGDDELMGPLLLVPQGRSCPLVAFGDLLEGAQVSALPDGGLLMVGGLDEGGIATTRVLLAGAGEREALVLAPEDAMQFDRVGHRLVDLGDRIMILGGALSAGDTAIDEWEMYDVASRRVLDEVGQMRSRRIHHAAVRLSDGRVLVTGGRQQGESDPIATAELIDPEDGSTTEVADMPIARAGHEMVTLDDGTTIVVGGFGSSDAFLPYPLVWDAGTQTLVQNEVAVGLWNDGFVLVPMEGGRLVVIGDAFGSQNTSKAVLLRHGADPGFGPPRLELDELDLQIPDLTSVRGAQLDDGRLLVTGRDGAGDPRAFAFRIGPTNAAGETLGEELDASPRVPDELLVLRDGLVMELAANGASVRREATLRTFLHNVGATVLGEDLSLDGPGRWSELGAELIALRTNARADVPTLRFADVAIHVTVTPGEENRGVEVLLRPENAAPVTVLIRADTVGPALCETERAPGAPVTIERRRDQVRIEAGLQPKTCTLDSLRGRIGVGFRARDVGARLSGISVVRL